MKRIILAVSSILISQILPLLGNPQLILHKQNVVIMIANAAIWLTQPPVSGSETVQNKSRDKFSVLLILCFSLGSIIIAVIDWAYLNLTLTSGYLSIIGLILIIFGILLRFWSIQVLGKFFTATVQIKEDHVLIIKGPYSIVRHPSYLGAWLTITGATVYFGSYIAFIVAVMGMGISYYIRINLEEKALIEMFGEQYKNYQQRVKGIIPFIW
ncbi:MAG TPA: isoprenylcysteine carboxylmethyltransferase family protein [Parafilimonas sp.]|nr:isoprenylcysteine carboxylmethyltransferase family protein [Parafilimonas sp.]